MTTSGFLALRHLPQLLPSLALSVLHRSCLTHSFTAVEFQTCAQAPCSSWSHKPVPLARLVMLHACSLQLPCLSASPLVLGVSGHPWGQCQGWGYKREKKPWRTKGLDSHSVSKPRKIGYFPTSTHAQKQCKVPFLNGSK